MSSAGRRSSSPTVSPLKRDPSRQSLISMNEELNSVLTGVKERQKNKFRTIDIKQTPEIYIYHNSSPFEVQEWLKNKGFDTKICKTLKDLNGQNLFDFKKEELIKIFGQKEGARLFSQLNIQKSISGVSILARNNNRGFAAKTSSISVFFYTNIIICRVC